MNEMYDLIIIGGGVAACEAAEQARKNELSVLLFEKKAFGGTCLNHGCIPSKYYLSFAHELEQIENRKKQGVIKGEETIDFLQISRKQRQTIHSMGQSMQQGLVQMGVKVIQEEAWVEKIEDSNIVVQAGNESYYGKKLIVATGSETKLPPIEGLEDEIKQGFAVTSKELFQMEELPESMVIVGAGVSGIEMAYAFSQFGTKVFVLEAMDRILPGVDSEYAKEIQSICRQNGVEFKLNVRIREICEGSVVYQCEDDEDVLECDIVYLCTGRTPNNAPVKDLVEKDTRGFIKTDHHFETSIKNVFAIGDVNGKSLLAHSAITQAKAVIDFMIDEKQEQNCALVPQIIYMNPEYAQIGENEETAKEKGISCHKVSCSMNYSGRFIATHGEMCRHGSMKLLIGDDDTIIGASILSTYASEIIMSLNFMISEKMSCQDIMNYIFPHPTEGELVRKCIMEYLKQKQ